MRAAQASAGDSAQVSRPRISAARLPGERLCIRADGGDATCFLAPPAAALWRGGVGGAPLCGAHSSLGSCRPFPATHVGPSSQGDGAGRASGQPAGAPPLP